MTYDGSTTRLLVLLAVGGAAGTILRYLVSATLNRAHFPWGTFTVNLVGSVALAALVFGGPITSTWAPELQLLFGVALLGSFTTMSTFSVETLELLREGALGRAGAYWGLNAIGCILGAVAGARLADPVRAAVRSLPL